eukprot:3414162-Amphidinium_carterae.1
MCFNSVHTFEHQYQILAVSFDDPAERIFSGSLDNTILVYDMRMRDADPETLEGTAANRVSEDTTPPTKWGTQFPQNKLI